uniref:Uncharacterized protein n=1 Tax=Sparus aurata TaxID=8175 RepID=A0A671UYD5_SPAAU
MSGKLRSLVFTMTPSISPGWTYCTLLVQDIVLSFQDLKDNFGLQTQDHCRYLQIRDFVNKKFPVDATSIDMLLKTDATSTDATSNGCATSTDATSTDATSADATSADASSTDATSADATSIDATSTDATSANATSADATSTDATSTDGTSTDATSADATSTDATSTDATSADATSTDATSTDCYLNRCYLSGCYFNGCYLNGCYLSRCYLSGCYFKDATSTDATSTDATSADATSTDATSADATSADATSTDATSADATSTDATLTDATSKILRRQECFLPQNKQREATQHHRKSGIGPANSKWTRMSSASRREFSWKNVTQFFSTPAQKTNYSNQTACWRSYGNTLANHYHIFGPVPLWLHFGKTSTGVWKLFLKRNVVKLYNHVFG